MTLSCYDRCSYNSQQTILDLASNGLKEVTVTYVRMSLAMRSDIIRGLDCSQAQEIQTVAEAPGNMLTHLCRQNRARSQ